MQDVEVRVRDLLSRMTLEEKVGQLQQVQAAGGHVSDALRDATRAGRIGSIINEVDLATVDTLQWIAVTEFRQGKLAIRWGVVLDRQRTLMLGEILQMVARLTDRAARTKSLTPAAPSKHTPGFGAWEMAIEMTRRNGFCQRCPYRLGTNLRCETCRQWHLDERGAPAALRGASRRSPARCGGGRA